MRIVHPVKETCKAKSTYTLGKCHFLPPWGGGEKDLRNFAFPPAVVKVMFPPDLDYQFYDPPQASCLEVKLKWLSLKQIW